MKIRYDLHIHSALSPCGDEDMTPNNILNMAMICGLNMIAISDHNTAGNVESAIRVGERMGITVVPAMELEVQEEIHVLCLFPSLEKLIAFEQEQVAPALPSVQNKVEIFGRQLLMDAEDQIVGEDPRYLINATAISLDDLPALVRKYEGIAIPAHIDKSTKSLVGNFGMVGDYMGFHAFELSRHLPEGFIAGTPGLGNRPYRYIHNSDAHYLEDIGEHSGDNFLELSENTPEALINFLNNKKIL